VSLSSRGPEGPVGILRPHLVKSLGEKIPTLASLVRDDNAMTELQGRTAIVTGAASGIGRAIAVLFAQRGARVALLDHTEEKTREVEDQITRAGGQATAVICDVTRQRDVADAFAKIEQQLGPANILVNSAGVAHVGTVETTSEEDFDRVYSVNVKGVYNCLKAAVPSMKARGGGVILNIASIVATVGIPDRFAYSMSKGAVLTMTLSVARDYVQHNIRCNCVAPARVHTPFVDGFLAKNYPGREREMFEKLSQTQPIGRMGKPEEIAGLALYLCSDAASFITGSNVPIDGGFVTLKM
jgi:NAD(P)-dependent dehydrogenase (short-subunit alcohol dehydrogenase family)